MYITESKTLNDFNEVQFIGVLYPAITGRAWMILRGLQPGIVMLVGGCGLFDLHIFATGDGST